MTETYSQWHQRRSCRTKVRYPARWVAANAALLHQWAGRPGMEAYSCRHCRQWHIGHPRTQTTPHRQEDAA